jgi:hypothetical protein
MLLALSDSLLSNPRSVVPIGLITFFSKRYNIKGKVEGATNT